MSKPDPDTFAALCRSDAEFRVVVGAAWGVPDPEAALDAVQIERLESRGYSVSNTKYTMTFYPAPVAPSEAQPAPKRKRGRK